MGAARYCGISSTSCPLASASRQFCHTTEAQFDTLMKIHLKGAFFLTQALLPLMADGGRIINLSSGLARFTLPGHAAYAAMKGGVEVLTRYLALELGARGITVNSVAPGAIATDFGRAVVCDNEKVNAQVAGPTAMGRAGLPDDIGGVVASLLSDENRWINGGTDRSLGRHAPVGVFRQGRFRRRHDCGRSPWPGTAPHRRAASGRERCRRRAVLQRRC